MKTIGVFLIAFGKHSYYHFAANFALSIKKHNPDLKIFLWTDSGFNLSAFHRSLFDEIETIPEHIIYPNGKLDPANVKLNIYDYLPFDSNIVLDVDALCVSSFDNFIDSFENDSGYFFTKLIDTHTIDKGRTIQNMVWAYADDIWNQYGLNDKSVLPCINSSFLYIKKCDESKELYNKAISNYENKLPLTKLRNQWGGGQPDELYMNIAMAQVGITGKSPVDPIYLCNKMSETPIHVLSNTFPIFSFFGNKNTQRSMFVDLYDMKLIKWYYEKGFKHIYKWSNIKADKHANIKPTKVSVNDAVYSDTTILPLNIKGKTTLFVPFFIPERTERKNEILTVLQKNIDGKDIDKIVLVCESDIDIPIHSGKIEKVNVGKRQTYKDLVSLFSDGINIIANSDIYFDERSIRLIKSANMTGKLMALSRYDVKESGQAVHFNYEWSQDAWVCSGKMNTDGMDIDFVFGKPACDNRFAFEAAKKYKVFNPSFSIKTYHLHIDKERSYTEADRLPGPVKAVPCETLKDIKKRMLIKQPGKVGDIICCLPIAKQFSKDYIIDWECPEIYHELFEYIDYCSPIKSGIGKYDRVVDMSFGLGGDPEVWWIHNKKRFNSFVTAKYELAGVNVSECRNLVYIRNEKKEKELFDKLVKSDNYAVLHPFSDYGTPPKIETSLPVIEFKKVDGYSIFDWRKILENAKEIHCIDSSLCNFVDTLILGAELFYYKTDRVKNKWDETVLTKKWNRINILQES